MSGHSGRCFRARKRRLRRKERQREITEALAPFMGHALSVREQAKLARVIQGLWERGVIRDPNVYFINDVRERRAKSNHRAAHDLLARMLGTRTAVA